MANIEKLYELQNCYDEIDKNKHILKDGSYLYLLKKMKNEFEDNKNNYNDEIKALKELHLEYGSINVKLKDTKEKIDKDEDILYNRGNKGSAYDMKSINALQNSIKSNKLKFKNIEDEAIEMLEKEEKLKNNLDISKEKLINVKDNFYTYKNKSAAKIEEAKKNLESLKLKVEDIKAKIDEEYLNQFYSIHNEKKKAVVKLNKGICEGCKMKVSAITLDKIGKEDKLVYCENCGRILIKGENIKAKKKRKIVTEK
ncbi:MAG: C4-type zinc ribbon domain-containing protein [Clostridium sp.]|nr:C4-type zinc ribbon domain-containing protein [Clostridium sp.]